MTDETTGMGAEVTAKKRNREGEVVETSTGGDSTPQTTLRGWIILAILLILSTFGLWKIVELILAVI